MADDTSLAFPSDIGSQIQGLLSAMGPPQADIDAANKQAQLAFFLGLLGAPKGGEFAAMGQSGLNALNQRNNYINNQLKQRAEMMQVAAPLIQIAQNQRFGKMMQDALNQPSASTAVPTQDGAPAPFQQPGGASALMNGAIGGGMPQQSSLPTQVPVPGAVSPAEKQFNALNNINLVGMAMGRPDMAPAINAKFPQPIALRPNAAAIDRFGNVIAPPMPTPPSGSRYDYQTQSFVPVNGAPQALAQPTVAKNLADLATEPQIGILPGGSEGVVGTKLGALGGAGGNYSFLNNLFGAQGQSGAAPTQSPMQTPTPVPGPVQTKLSPEQEQRQKALGELPNAIDNQATQAQYSLGRNEDMRNLFSQFNTGAMTPVRREVASVAQSFNLPNSVVTSIAGGNLPAMQAAQKQVVNAAFEATKALTPRPAQAEVIMSATKGTANEVMTQQAINAILDYNKGIYQYQLDMQKAKDAWLANPSHHGSMQGFAGSFNQTNPLDAYLPSADYLRQVLNAPTQRYNAPQAPAPTPAVAPAGWSIKRIN